MSERVNERASLVELLLRQFFEVWDYLVCGGGDSPLLTT